MWPTLPVLLAETATDGVRPPCIVAEGSTATTRRPVFLGCVLTLPGTSAEVAHRASTKTTPSTTSTRASLKEHPAVLAKRCRLLRRRATEPARRRTANPAPPRRRAPPASAKTADAQGQNASRRRAPAATRMATAISAPLATR